MTLPLVGPLLDNANSYSYSYTCIPKFEHHSILQAGQVTHSSSLNFVPYFENVIKKKQTLQVPR